MTETLNIKRRKEGAATPPPPSFLPTPEHPVISNPKGVRNLNNYNTIKLELKGICKTKYPPLSGYLY